ncbi:MAG: adenylate/guanylate cyclase domain-containing protein [Saprospiraceae bacterium]|nr:adenylate/guanylate cyclase domain-containing protein [Saprospiraceae bacterium]
MCQKLVLQLVLPCLCINGIFCQNQKLADSLELIYSSGKYVQTDKLGILKGLAVNHTDTEKKLLYSIALIQSAKDLDSIDYLFSGYQEKGNALRLKSDLNHALESYLKAAELVRKDKSNRRLGGIYIAIADVYSIMENHQNSTNYYKKAIDLLRVSNDPISLASALLNAGDEYCNVGKLDSALMYTEESQLIFDQNKSNLGQAYSLGNLGMIYAKSGNKVQAEKNINKAIILLENLGEFYPICDYLGSMSEIYYERGEIQKALSYSGRSLQLAQKNGLKDQVSDANLKMSKYYEKLGDFSKSLQHYKNYVTYRDSVSNITSVQLMADQRTDFEVSQKQVELNQQKRNQEIIAIAAAIALGLIIIIAIGLYRRNRFIKKTNTIIEEEKNRAELLLLNILPEGTANELKQNGKVQAKKFESATVLFTDFKEFTHYAEYLSPELLVESVDLYFSKFDEIMDKYNLEK